MKRNNPPAFHLGKGPEELGWASKKAWRIIARGQRGKNPRRGGDTGRAKAFAISRKKTTGSKPPRRSSTAKGKQKRGECAD